MRTRTLCSLFGVLEANAGLWWAEHADPRSEDGEPPLPATENPQQQQLETAELCQPEIR